MARPDTEFKSDAGGVETGKSSIAVVLENLHVRPEVGLTSFEAQSRLKRYGPNAIEEKKKSALTAFLGYFWGPIPWMIEAAAIMALIVKDWGDFIIITALLCSMLSWDSGKSMWPPTHSMR